MKLLTSSAKLSTTTRTLFVAAILMLLWSGFAAAQDIESPVAVKLTLANGKDVYRSGETVGLVLSFSTDLPGYKVQGDQGTYLEKVVISPQSGVFDWKTDFYGGEERPSDGSGFSVLGNVPTEVKISLNDYYRFDAPGKYTVRLITKRLRKDKAGGGLFDFEDPTEITTNVVSFEIKPMTDAEEEAEAKRLGSAIESAKGMPEQIRFAQDLANLPGDTAIPEKVSRYLWSLKQSGGNFAGALSKGLFISRNRALVIRKLEDILSDVSKAVDFNVLSTLSFLRARVVIAESGKPYKRPSDFLPLPADDPYTKAKQYYLRFVIDSLQKRTGKNLVDTAAGIIVMEHRDLEPDILATVRGILLKNFDSLDILAREQLVSIRWEQIRDPSLVPSLERMLRAIDYPTMYRLNVHTTALTRLAELDQARARPFVIADIIDTESLLYDGAFDNFKEASLPEVDGPLLADIKKYGRTDAATRNAVRLRHKCMLAARFATGSIYDQLMDVYKSDGPKWQWQSRAILLGYFARYNETEALALVEQELSVVEKEWRGTFLNDLTRVNFPPKVAELFAKRLASDDPDIAGEAAYLISQHGSETDRSKIESRLKQWQSIWNKRLKELDDPAPSPETTRQANLQAELIMALLQGKAWKLTDDDKKELRTNCLSAICRNRFHW